MVRCHCQAWTNTKKVLRANSSWIPCFFPEYRIVRDWDIKTEYQLFFSEYWTDIQLFATPCYNSLFDWVEATISMSQLPNLAYLSHLCCACGQFKVWEGVHCGSNTVMPNRIRTRWRLQWLLTVTSDSSWGIWGWRNSLFVLLIVS